MPEDNNIKEFTATDIEKYWKGELSKKEMNALEKAAMDDPFLADALEGYKYTQTADEDLAVLVQHMDERTGKAAIVKPMSAPKLPWLRIAAAIVIITGVGIIATRIFINDSPNEKVAITPVDIQTQKDSTSNLEFKVNDTTTKNFGTTLSRSDLNLDTGKSNNAYYNWRRADQPAVGETQKADTGALVVVDALADRKTATTYPPVPSSTKVLNDDLAQAESRDNKEKGLVQDIEESKKQIQKRAAADKMDNYGFNKGGYVFNGRVVDASNNPVPFANVSNNRDQVGTYSDIRGNFNLVSYDTTLDLQVRALGYETRNYTVSSNRTGNILVMRGDLMAKNAAPQNNNYKIKLNPKPISDSTEYEEEEGIKPEVGWGNYNTYLANNLKINPNQQGASREIQLSFQIDKTGQPTNIKVTRSSQCTACDQEAIRALKEGPKWKQSGKKKRSKQTITISLDDN